MRQHLKRLAAPRHWTLARRAQTFTVRPQSSGHPFAEGLALGVILRDILKHASTLTEAKKLLDRHPVLVDGVRRRDYRYLVGLFDVLSFPELKASYRILSDLKGNVKLKPLPFSVQHKWCKVMGKTLLAGGKVQLHLHDGKNILFDKEVHRGDTVQVSFPQLVIQEVLPLRPGAKVFLLKGKYQGSWGIFSRCVGQRALYEQEGVVRETVRKYLFVLPEALAQEMAR